MAVKKFRVPNGLDVAGDIIVTGLVDGVDVSQHSTQTGVGGHIPSGGTSGQYLKHDGTWGIPAGTYVHPNHTGDVTSTGDGATTIQDNKIGASKLKGSGAVALPNGANGQVLKSNGDGTFSWLSLGGASAKEVVTTIDTSANLPTSNAVKTYVDSVSAGIGTVHAPVQDVASAKALTDMTDKQILLIENLGLYRFDANDTATAGDDNRVIVPTNASLGRWFKISATINDHANLSNVDKWNGNSANTYHVPNVTGNTAQFLRGDGTWGIPAGTYVHPNHTGEVTSSGDGATTIASNVISANKLKGGSGSALPNGSAGQVLQSNGDGTFSWQSLPSPTQVGYTYGISVSGNYNNLTATPVVIDSFPKATYRGAKWLISITDTTNARYETLMLIANHDGTTCYQTEFGNVGTATLVGATFNVVVNGTNIELQASLSGSASNNVKFIRDAIAV